ncbi:1,4-dihydroxy-2-naphthoate octaprenyltransferase [Psychromonas sp. RZ22]|uniref:1,4-dihydroxy-2-naphthoate octaprenyltransferase n=1 Tax=Psychromonas algarum TaxID=2555643 RepID=UPI001068C4BF|nr:1,4-dihydroxy-2-naphthoate octaprenyltransferase [Psychromonas sp. RZ22]TEW53370.1 1,4-dihydroxy-2-naphthoate octaprenyltransferase [Psychromonas sp. RZ22]
MKLFTVWIEALRLRTLPLAAASIIVAAGLAVQYQVFNLGIFLLSLTTALLLQILSNLANDYGDAMTGADEQRVGPQRAMQSGLITAVAMKKAIIIAVIACLISGITLLSISFTNDIARWLTFLGLGIAAIIAAITYTMGRLPYGYRSMGDLAVFIFFGLLGVLGSFYLQALVLPAVLILPAISVGLLSAAVLNINNMRDVYHDKAANKITLVVLLGREKAFKYHLLLLTGAMLCSFLYIYSLEDSQVWQYLFLLIASPLIKSCIQISNAIKGDDRKGTVFNEQLKNTAISTFVFSLLFSIALIA